jgi:hypothetical protein
MKEAGTFFKEPDKIKAWGDNVRSIPRSSSFGLIAVMGIVIAATAKIRSFQCCWP